MVKSIVIIPTYNEKENISDIIEKVFSLDVPFHVLVVDDNSPDGTGQIVKDLIQNKFKDTLFLLEREGKQGLGTAYIAGFKWCLDHQYDFIFEMDADFSHNPEDLVRLYQACHEDGYDLAVGSRYISGANVVNWPLARVLLSYYASRYVSIVTGMPIKDTTAGFVCYTAEVLQTLELDKIKFKGYAFQIEMKFLTWKYDFKIKEVPIIFTDRTRGVSKMNKSIIKEAFWGVIQMKVNSLFRKFERKSN
ncbi:MAG: polyprenol monophosphomannose synthase [Bacteroidetes bacterium]|nr:polyprenol monophosphomannose synthase [Bacteroidota bacterium]